MMPKPWILTAITLFCAAISAQLFSQLEPAVQDLPRYTVVDLGTFGTEFSVGQGINNKGWVDGIFGAQNQHEFVLRKGVVTDVGTLGGPNSGVGSFGQSPNERGQIVGAAESSAIDPLGEAFCNFLLMSPPTKNVCLPFIWQDGVMTPLPTLGGTNGGASRINNRGQVVGTAENTTMDLTCSVPHLNTEPVIWEEGGIRQLPTVGGDPGGGVDDINDKGQAVGATGNCANSHHAVLWEEGAAIDLGNLGGTFFFEATAINNQSQVVGFSDLPGDTMFHAFLCQDGLMHDLGALSGDSVSFASAINNRSQIVGTSCLDAFFTNCGAFLWQNGTMLDLNNLISGSNLFLVLAIGINDRGEIVGSTADFHAYLATPCDDNTGGCAESAQGTAMANRNRSVVLHEKMRERLLRQLRSSFVDPSQRRH